MTNLDTILKNRDITLLTKVHIVKAVVFPIVKYGCESWTIKKAASGWVLVAQFCPTLCNSMDCSCQAPLFMEFSRQEYWSRQPFSSAGDIPDPDLDRTQVLQADSLPSKLPGKPASREAKEDWAPKNRCFQIVVLEKTLESLLDCKEITPVNPKGDQPWIFIRRTVAES